MALVLLLNGFYILPWYTEPGYTAPGYTSAEQIEQTYKQRLKLIQSNVNTANQDHQKVIELVKTEQPDIFVALERRMVK